MNLPNQSQHPNFNFEIEAQDAGYQCIAGVDEAGRGPLAGPVVAAACILPQEDSPIAGINDSKKLTPQQRQRLYQQLTSHPKVTYALGVVQAEVIDVINILQATIQSMQEAVAQLVRAPDFLLVDGLALKEVSISSKKVIKGDARSYSIAAASIIAKVYRDELMLQYHEKWPKYGFNQHKGYGTKAHIEAIQSHGPCPIHRKTFEPIKSLLS